MLESPSLPPGSILYQDAGGAPNYTGRGSLPDSRTSGCVILPVESVASFYQHLYDRRLHLISLGGERHVDHVRLMGDGRPGARGCSDDKQGEAEHAKSAGHLALLAFNR